MSDLKLKTARTLKWNTFDRLSSQVLYAVTGIVLANLLTQEQFGLVGAILVFQAFATLFVDSGFSNALIQRKNPTDTDYSTVFYFNLGMSVAIYAILWFCSPLIDDIFHAGGRLVPLARVMFLTFILNATAIVQTNRLMKQMNVRMIAISNAVGLILSGAVGIWMAIDGWGAWAIVWQSVVLSAVKSGVLWLTSSWRPRLVFSTKSLRSIFSVGIGIMSSSFLNILFQNIYSFIIGAYYNLARLGCYTQADKWSKMGVTSLSQVVTASFLPILSGCQDDKARFHYMMGKTDRFTAYVTFPCLILLIVISEAVFHTLFGTKWDEAILLFQLLAARGIFIVLTSLYNNHILAIGAPRQLVYSEIVKDVLAIVAIIVTVPLGVEWLVGGQVIAAVLYFGYSIYLTARTTGYKAQTMLVELLPYTALSLVSAVPAAALQHYCIIGNPIALLAAQCVAFALPYLALNAVLHSHIQSEVMTYAFGRFTHKKI